MGILQPVPWDQGGTITPTVLFIAQGTFATLVFVLRGLPDGVLEMPCRGLEGRVGCLRLSSEEAVAQAIVPEMKAVIGRSLGQKVWNSAPPTPNSQLFKKI